MRAGDRDRTLLLLVGRRCHDTRESEDVGRAGSEEGLPAMLEFAWLRLLTPHYEPLRIAGMSMSVALAKIGSKAHK
jgi:hypothetical protein